MDRGDGDHIQEHRLPEQLEAGLESTIETLWDSVFAAMAERYNIPTNRNEFCARLYKEIKEDPFGVSSHEDLVVRGAFLLSSLYKRGEPDEKE